MYRTPWSKDEDKKLWEVVKDARTVEEALTRARKAFPKRGLTIDGLRSRLVKMGRPSIYRVVTTNAPPEPAELVKEYQQRDLVAEMREERTKILAELSDVQKQLEVLKGLRAIKAARPISEGRRVGATQRRATAVLICSDWHVEEKVDPKTVNGLNRWNLELAEKAIDSLADSFAWMTLDQRFDVREAVLALLGDFFSGHIHDELIEGNFLSPVQAVAWLLPRMERMLRKIAVLLPSIGRFVVMCNDGNHGRLTKKIRMATRTANSLEWLLFFNLAARMKDDPRFEFQIAEGVWNYLDLYGKTYGFCHGDIYRYGGGVGGLLIPVRRGLNEDRKYLSFDPQMGEDAQPTRRLDHVAMGHFHTRMDLDEGLSVNGSLIGISPYSMANHFPPEAPKQSWFMVDSRRGKCVSAPIWLPSRGAPNEGKVAGK